jgi:hypothetical protein
VRPRPSPSLSAGAASRRSSRPSSSSASSKPSRSASASGSRPCGRASAARPSGWYNQGEADATAGLETAHADFFGQVAGARGEFAYQAAKWLWEGRDKPSKGKSADDVKFLLERQYPEDFGPRRAVELSGPDGGAIQVQSLDELISKARGGGSGSDPKGA